MRIHRIENWRWIPQVKIGTYWTLTIIHNVYFLRWGFWLLLIHSPVKKQRYFSRNHNV
jgi:hypothetical protein